MARQIEIAVVGEVEHRVPVADRLIGNSKNVIGLQGIGHPDFCVSGVALIPMGTVQRQGDGSLRVGLHLPHPLEKVIRAGMEVVLSLVRYQGISFAAQGEGRLLQPVGDAAHRGSQAGIPVEIARAGIVPQHHIRRCPRAVRNQQTDQGGPEVGDRRRNPAPGYGVQGRRFPRGQNAERFFHENDPFHFSSRKAGNYVKIDF